jgi:hypothetical protein
MWFMHNRHSVYASRETTASRFEPSDYVCRDCGGKERNGSRITAIAEPACGKQSSAARAMFQDDLLVRSPLGFELTLRGRKILHGLESLLPKMEHLIVPTLFDPVREKSHFRISGPDNVCTVLIPRLCRKYANAHYQVQFEFFHGKTTSRTFWTTGSSILYSALMTGSCRHTFRRKGYIGRTLFAPWRMIAGLVTGCRSSNTWWRATSLFPLLPVCRRLRTSGWRLLVQDAPRVFACLISAWLCNAFPAQNSCLP